MNNQKTLAALQDELVEAKTAYEHCSYHDDYQRMRACQGECQLEIDRLKAAVAEAEKP